MYQKILVPMALDHGLSPRLFALAKQLLTGGGTITALHVFEKPHGIAAATLSLDVLQESLAQAQTMMTEKLADYPGVEGKMVEGHVHRSILDFAAQTDVDCIVMGSHRPGLTDYFIGSTAARIVRHAPCSVHLCRDL